MEYITPIHGQRDTCEMCGEPIVFIGPYWDHIGENKPRHPATPPTGIAITDEPEEPITPGMAIRSVTLDLMMRKRDWQGKPDPHGVASHIDKLIEALNQAMKDLQRYEEVKKALTFLRTLD